MTIEELIIFNSSIPAGDGTVLEHLMNVRVERDIIYSQEIDVESAAINVTIVNEQITVVLDSEIDVDLIEEDIVIETETQIGVKI